MDYTIRSRVIDSSQIKGFSMHSPSPQPSPAGRGRIRSVSVDASVAMDHTHSNRREHINLFDQQEQD